ncbi:Uncharacterised protein [Streptococcus pneumoniae]|nr:Uncharacterised protein [Streptococcus pneumoniae]
MFFAVNFIDKAAAMFNRRMHKDMMVNFIIARVRKGTSFCLQSDDLTDKLNTVLTLINQVPVHLVHTVRSIIAIHRTLSIIMGQLTIFTSRNQFGTTKFLTDFHKGHPLHEQIHGCGSFDLAHDLL